MTASNDKCDKCGMNPDHIVALTVKAVREYDAKNKKSKQDRRLRNMKLLLENYRMLQDHCKNAIYKFNQQTREDAIDILDELTDKEDDIYIESIKRSVTRTSIIVAHIRAMMDLYKLYCERAKKKEDQRGYRVLNAIYFEDAGVEEIMERENISQKTYYRDVNRASNKLSALIFGVDGVFKTDD